MTKNKKSWWQWWKKSSKEDSENNDNDLKSDQQIQEEEKVFKEEQPTSEIDEKINSKEEEENQKTKNVSLLERLKGSLLKTKRYMGGGFRFLFKGKKIDSNLLEELENKLIMADVGVSTTSKIMQDLHKNCKLHESSVGDLVLKRLEELMLDILKPSSVSLSIDSHKPFIILTVGVNGAGKTTTLAKLAYKFKNAGKAPLLVAADTFRAAAIEQLSSWGDRYDIPVIAHKQGSDAASVVYGALESAKARKADVILIDTAGRLQNNDQLMAELCKIIRVMKKIVPDAPHEVLMVLDAITGQNTISQVSLFNEKVKVTGLVLTKLDSSAKGGIIFALSEQFKIPIRYVGLGESVEDLREFDSKDFVSALLSD